MNDIVTDQPHNGQAEAQAEQAQPQRVSLDALSEFDFQGKTFTPDRLQEIFQGYESLSARQKQSQSEDRYWQNLDADIEQVQANPQLAEKFKSIYPEKFHRVLDRILSGQAQRSDTSAPQIPKEIMAKLSNVDRLEAQLHQMAVDSANAKLDMILPKLYEKFPLANEDQVLAKAEAMLSQGMKLNEQTWERIAKESHEAMTKKADAFYKKQLQTQLNKGQMGKDAPGGGQIPGRAPNKGPRTFDEAREQMMAHIAAQGR